VLLREMKAELGAGVGDLRFDALGDDVPYVATDIVEDEVPEPPAVAVTQPGDLWTLGAHRLLCGDAGSAAHLDRLLGAEKIQLVHTDPPYNVKVEPRSNNAIAAGLSSNRGTHHQLFDLALHPEKAKATTGRLRPRDRQLAGDFISDEEFLERLDAWFQNFARVLEPGRAFYIWGGYSNWANYPAAIAGAGLYFAHGIVWVKLHPSLTRKDFLGNHEECFYGWREGAAHQWLGPHNAVDVWQVKKINPAAMVHLTEKPVELGAMAMRYSSREGENVLDTFGGSGSTMSAAEQLGRHAFLMELDPLYCDVMVERWQNLTGQTATRQSAAA
jgi:DNA modification methylase